MWGSGWFLIGDPASLDAEVSVSFYDITDTLISTVTGSLVALPSGEWARAYVDAIAPATTAKARLTLNMVGNVTNGDIVGWVDAAMLTVGETLSDYFDGDTPDTSVYSYSWDGTQDSSTSTRTPCAAIYGTTILNVLTDTPKGLGHPDIRTEDTTYAQRDGVTHWNDWYGPRFVTLVGSLHPDHDASCDADTCLTVRTNRFLLSQAFKRQCNDLELILYPPCEAGEDVEQRAITGPFAFVGRPRVFDSEWLYRDDQVADFLIRFDTVDQRIYVTDPCGTPGLVEQYEIQVGTSDNCVEFPYCFTGAGLCFDVDVDDDAEPVEVTIAGSECVNPTLTLFPGLTKPRIQNLTTGDWIGYNANIVDTPVIINTLDGTATQGGVSVTHNLIGSLQFSMEPGDYVIRMLSNSLDDDGYAVLAYRPTVLVA